MFHDKIVLDSSEISIEEITLWDGDRTWRASIPKMSLTFYNMNENEAFHNLGDKFYEIINSLREDKGITGVENFLDSLGVKWNYLNEVDCNYYDAETGATYTKIVVAA